MMILSVFLNFFPFLESEDLKEEDLEKAAVKLKDKVVALEDQLNRFAV